MKTERSITIIPLNDNFYIEAESYKEGEYTSHPVTFYAFYYTKSHHRFCEVVFNTVTKTFKIKTQSINKDELKVINDFVLTVI